MFDTLRKKALKWEILQISRSSLNKRPNFLPMLYFHGFLTQSFNELRVFGNFIYFFESCFVNLIFDISTNLRLKL